MSSSDLLAMTVRIVCAHVGFNSVPAEKVPELVETVHRALSSTTSAVEPPPAPVLRPAVSIRRSVGEDYVICLECGLRQKMLKRHLWTAHGLTPEEYRVKWGLAPDYPVVAPGYSAVRSQMAKEIGLGSRTAAGRPSARPRGRPRAGSERERPQ